MKTNKKLSSLALNKRTVSRLTASELIDARGGADLVVVNTRDCVLIPIDYTIPALSEACEPDPEPWKPTVVVSLQMG